MIAQTSPAYPTKYLFSLQQFIGGEWVIIWTVDDFCFVALIYLLHRAGHPLAGAAIATRVLL